MIKHLCRNLAAIFLVTFWVSTNSCVNKKSEIHHKDSNTKTITRTTNLGISGYFKKPLVPGPNFYNINQNVTGSAVKNHLIPNLSPLLNIQIRDASICIGGDGIYYLTGSTGDDIWDFNDGIELWKSKDLKKWVYLGLVWSFDKDATWQKEWRIHKGKKCRAIWAPELCYIQGNYYLTYSMPPGDRGILVSKSGKPEGPYINALANDGKLQGDIDASLFVDDDGIIYLVYGSGWIVKMKTDLSGIEGKPKKVKLINPDINPNHHATICPPRRGCNDIGRESAFLFKNEGTYYLSVTDTYEGRYSSMVVVSDSVFGPYKNRHEAVPGGGGGSYFKDKTGNWYCTFFGNDNQMPWREKPGLIKVNVKNEKISIARDQNFVQKK